MSTYDRILKGGFMETDRLRYIGKKEDEGRKIISILTNEFTMSARMIRGLKTSKSLFLNGNEAKTIDRIKENDEIVCLLNRQPIKTNVIASKVDFSTLYEDDALLVCFKPPDLVSHPVRTYLTNTLLNGVAYKMHEDKKEYGLHLVSRLDKDTSGIVIIAKNPYIQEQLKLQHEKGIFIKKYLGITKGIPKEKTSTIYAPIARKDSSIIERVIDENGLMSITEYRLLETYGDYGLVEFIPKTGRTHQIRVHSLHMGFPLLGDTLYGNDNSQIIGRQALHAYKVSFIHPLLKKDMEILAPLPKDMEDAISKLKAIDL